MSDYNFLKLAKEREDNARALRLAYEEIDLLRARVKELEGERKIILDQWGRVFGTTIGNKEGLNQQQELLKLYYVIKEVIN